jgi:hypothetical protein
MGNFTRAVRYEDIPGPNKPAFDVSLWERIAVSPEADDSDRQTAIAGLYFDALLKTIRRRQVLQDSKLPPHAIGSLAIGIVNLSYCHLIRETAPAIEVLRSIHEGPRLRATPSMDQPSSVDERLSSLGDGLKYLLMRFHSEAVTEPMSCQCPSLDDLRLITAELHNAINYHCVSDYYNECRANAFELLSTEHGPVLAPTDERMELSRVVSNYRRMLLANHDASLFLRLWWVTARDAKESMCEIKPVASVSFSGKHIGGIELKLDDRSLDNNASAIHAKLRFVVGPDREFLLDSLPKFGGIVLMDLIRAWQFAQSLSEAIFARINQNTDDTVENVVAACAAIPKALLLSTLAESLKIEESDATLLLNALTFRTSKPRQLWTQPFVRSGDEYCLVLPCIRSVTPRRILERWMDDGGIDLGPRGKEFERFVRKTLLAALESSPLRGSLTVLPAALRLFATIAGDAEVDVVIVLHEVILLVEVKCLLWPEDAIEFADYRNKVEKAAEQVARQIHVVCADPKGLAREIGNMGCSITESPRVVGCVLTSTATLAGTCVNGIPVVDLPLLEDFILGEYVESELWDGDQLVERQSVQLYEDSVQAAEYLEPLLINPPQLHEIHMAVQRREISCRLAPGPNGQFVYETFQVAM